MGRFPAVMTVLVVTLRSQALGMVSDTVVTRAAAGDLLAFEQIVAQYHDDLARVGFAITGDVETGRDAAQAAWETAWRKLSELRDTSRLRSWLLAIAANEARRQQRRQRLRRLLELRIDRPTPAPDPDQLAGRFDLDQALERLSARDRQMLALRFAIGLTSEEVGELMELTASGVRTHVSRLLDRLRKELNDG